MSESMLEVITPNMPNLWAGITYGSLDCYKSVFYQFSRVAERELTQIFLETLTGKSCGKTSSSIDLMKDFCIWGIQFKRKWIRAIKNFCKASKIHSSIDIRLEFKKGKECVS